MIHIEKIYIGNNPGWNVFYKKRPVITRERQQCGPLEIPIGTSGITNLLHCLVSVNRRASVGPKHPSPEVSRRVKLSVLFAVIFGGENERM